MSRMKNKIAVVTGGASGIGKGVVQRFVEEGATTVVTDINAEGSEVAASMGAEFQVQDVRDESGWQALIESVVAAYGRLDVLVNNAGIFSSSPIDQMDLETWQRTLDVNLTGVFLGCKYGVRQMKNNPDGPSGSIINLSSVVGLRGQLGGAAYSASKGGVKMLTKCVALENAPLGIRCNSIHPGVIDTPIMDPMREAAGDPEVFNAAISRTLPIGYMGDPARDIGNMAVYLACDESIYLTGTEMVVDGGMTIGLPSSRS